MIVWCTCALSISLALHRLRVHVIDAWHPGAILREIDGLPVTALAERRSDDEGAATPLLGNMVASQRHRLEAARQKLEGLPGLRLKGAEVIRCTDQKAPVAADLPSDRETDPLAVFANDLGTMNAAVPRNAGDDMTCPPVNPQVAGVTSGAALLAWIEQIVLASDVALRRFEPVVDDLTLQMSALQQGTRAMEKEVARDRLAHRAEEPVRMHDIGLTDGASKQPTHRAADVEISGSYAGLYSAMERLARTEPPLVVVSSRVRSDDQLIRWEARVVVADAGPFRLGAMPGVTRKAMSPSNAHPPVGESRPNPFARSALPGAGYTARLLGVMRLGTRNVGLFAYGNKRHLLEAGAMLGDARIVGIHSENGTPRAVLAPLTGESMRVLLLRSRP